MEADSALAALSVATTFGTHHCHNNVNVAVTALSVFTTTTLTSVHTNVATLLLLSLLLQRCQFALLNTPLLLPSLSQCCLGHCCHSTVKYTAVTIPCDVSVDSSVTVV